MRENEYQARLIKKLHRMFPDIQVLKNDPQYQQGILDLTVLLPDFWAALEVKRSRTAKERPNQDYFVHKLNGLSFAAVIYPENEEEVLDALQQAFEARGRSCVSKS